MNINKLLEERYTVKKFDTEFKLTDTQIEEMKSLLQMSPSSVNVQPWHFTIATSKEGIEKVAKSTANFGFNDEKIRDAQALVVMSILDVNDEHLTNVTEKEDQDGRYANEELKNATDNGRKYFFNLNKENNNERTWLSNQVYLNAGHFTLGCATLGLDTVIMEGFDANVLKAELGLENQSPVLIIGVGRGHDEDYNKNLPKSRLSKESLIDLI